MPKKEKANLFRIEFPAEKNKKTSRVEREMGGVNSYLSRRKKTLYGHPSRDYPFSINGNFSSSSHADCSSCSSSSAGDEMCVDLTIDRKYPPLELSGRRRRRCCRRVLAPVPRRFKKGNFPSEKPKKQNKTKLFREKICVHTQVLKTLHSRKVALAASSKDCTHAIYT